MTTQSAAVLAVLGEVAGLPGPVADIGAAPCSGVAHSPPGLIASVSWNRRP
jgi:hypothetical protein